MMHGMLCDWAATDFSLADVVDNLRSGCKHDECME